MQNKKSKIDKNIIPYDLSNSSNPYLITYNRNELLVRDDDELDAEYIWSLQGADRDCLVDWVYNYYKDKEFPNEELSNDEIIKIFKKLEVENELKVLSSDGSIKNSSTLGLDLIRYIFNDLFYSSKRFKSKSVKEVFNDEKEFKSVLRNRMGYALSKEDGTDRPYIFGLTDKMIIQGIRNSGKGSIISQFKPLVAKYIYSKYCKKGDKVFDYSAGWGARLLGALSLGLEYYGVDPLTSNNCNELINLLKGEGYVSNSCSEDVENYLLHNLTNDIDFIFSSPPYFNMEVYSEDLKQSYNKYSNYEEWLEKYWKQTVKNCYSILKSNGHFGIAMIDIFGKYEIAKDMNKIIIDNGFKLKEILPMITGKSHLTNKKEGKINKVNDIIYIFEKIK